MDDLTVTTMLVPGCRCLDGWERLITWAQMSFKPTKYGSLVLRKVANQFHFSLGGTWIPSISENPVKCLGKVFNSSLKVTESIKSTGQEKNLLAVDKSRLPAKFKAWIYQHAVLPQILSTVEGFEQKISQHLRRCLGLPRSLNSIALYGQKNKLTLPFAV